MEAIERMGVFLVFAIVLLAGSLIGSIMSGAINGIMQLFLGIFHISP
jgi:hypothetical protein